MHLKTTNTIPSPRHPPAINNNCLTSHVRTSPAGQIDRRPLELIRHSPSPHWNPGRDRVIVGRILVRPRIQIQISSNVPVQSRRQSTCTQHSPTRYTITASRTSEQTHPGAIALTRTPFPAHSLLKALVNCTTAPLLQAYAAILTPP